MPDVEVVVQFVPEDFTIQVPRVPEGAFGVTTGPDYPFMQKVVSAIPSNDRKVVQGPIRFRFENADGTCWGNLDVEGDPFWPSIDRLNCLSFFDKKPWAAPLLVKKLWVKQQVAAARALGYEDAPFGLFFKYADEVDKAFGHPARLRFQYQTYLSLVNKETL